MTRPEPVWKVAASLGEGPIWLPEQQTLYFVDIKLGHIHAWSPDSSRGTTWDVGESPSFIVRAEGNQLLVGSCNAVHFFEGGRLGRALFEVPEPANNRTNDATVDGLGRLWFGTMDDDEVEESGSIWCWDGSRLQRAGPRAVVTNGPAVSPDDYWLYHVDSVARTIWRCRLGEPPTLASQQVFITIEEGAGYPDGVIVDSEGCLWVALWDGWGVRRYSPEGELMLHVAMPCARVTKIAFGGPGLRTAFATTARAGLSDSDLADQPLAGSLFAFDAPAAGQVAGKVALWHQSGAVN